MISIKIKGDKELARALRELGPQVDQVTGQVVEATGLEIRGDIIRRYNRGPATGRVYRKNNPKRVHRASAPGEAPATDTTRLANGTVYAKTDPLTALISNAVKYVAWLEYGTRKIAPRPAWVPAVEAARKKFHKRLRAVIARAVKR